MKKIYTERSRSIKSQTVEEFLNDLASKSAAPGGGSVSALAGALAAALVSMVCRLTIGKKKYISVEKEMKKNLKESEKLRGCFLILAEKDKQAFLNVLKKKYSADSLKKAAAVPRETAELSDKVLNLAKRTALIGNKNALSDAKIAVDLARLAKRGALLNVKVNSWN